ncbi:Cytochrome P450 [Neofusicoccum parvum]|uniref:Cytochrome P450 n=1 Tax=Neofusicoccum parvum TaxID=310453 RepID=A0ACB5SIX1_9PEZI|nr:Cytochrome P450 [Neofusicoccum parvum]
MLVFNFAGHDSTDHSLTYVFYLLVAHPEVQDWINEEIRHVFKDSDVSTWSYKSFPQLPRCLAVLVRTPPTRPASSGRLPRPWPGGMRLR